jgi:hypothetical protein
MISRRCFCALSLLVAASNAARGFTPEALGFRQIALGRQEVERAIQQTNAILDRRAPVTLVPGWSAGAASTAQTVVVWIIRSPGVAKSALMEVPRSSCRCILIRINDIRTWIARAQTVGGQAALQFDISYILTFMLLHEVGHIVAGHPGQLDAVTDQSVIEPMARLTAQQCREIEADSFAARMIKSGLQNVGSTGWLEANWTANELSKLSFNLFGMRLIDRFPANALGLASVFGDRTYSHPNFDLRVYALNADISGDDTAKQLLEGFVQQRLQIGRPDVSCSGR